MALLVVTASDHTGLVLRAEAIRVARQKGFEVDDLGPFSAESSDYPDFARKVTEMVAAGKARFGILICGTGIGMCIAANKAKGIRAAHCTNEFEARMARAHNDANVLCMGERVIGVGLAASLVTVFLEQPFEGGRHARRVGKIGGLEGA